MSWNQNHMRQIMRFAAEAHAQQKVKDSPANYMLHLAWVASETLNAWVLQNDFDIHCALATAWLHDTLEDTSVSTEQVLALAGDKVLACVQVLTKDESLPYEQRMPHVLERLTQAPREASIVKMADRIVNLQPPPSSWSAQKCQSYLSEAKQIYEALGFQHQAMASKLLEQMQSYQKQIEGIAQ